LCSRRLKLDSFNYIRDSNFLTMLESRLSAEDVSLPQLGEGESFGLFDGGAKVVAFQNRAESSVIFAAQRRIGIAELNHTVKPAGSFQDCGIQASWVVRGCDHEDAILAPYSCAEMPIPR